MIPYRRRTVVLLLLAGCAVLYTLQYTSLAKSSKTTESQARPQALRHLWTYDKDTGERIKEKEGYVVEDKHSEGHIKFVPSAEKPKTQEDEYPVPQGNIQVYNAPEKDSNRLKKYWLQKLKERKDRIQDTKDAPYPLKNMAYHVPNENLVPPPRDLIPEQQLPLQPMADQPNAVAKENNNNLPAPGKVTKEPDAYVSPRRIVHLDFKGAPPKVSFLKKLFPLFKSAGATGLLIEWEDMLPYHGPLRSVAAKNHYSKDKVTQMLSLAKANGLEVIPLVQTFGHLEFVLKVNHWQHLREVHEVPQAVCPSLNDSLSLVKLLVDQTMSLHPGVKYLHIGCDEVFHLAECPRCIKRDRDTLFLSHVQKVAEYVKKTYHVTPIVWDDMLRHISTQDLNDYKMGELVEPMVWVYVSDIYRFVPQSVWDKYSSVFPTAWAASAYKGAFGPALYAVNVKRHLENNLVWLKVMQNEGATFKRGFQGIAITGWQRYDHFANLCELLPAAVPSIVVTLLATSNGYFDERLMRKLYKSLSCMETLRYHSYVDWDRDPHMFDKLAFCDFPGANFFRLVSRLKDAEAEMEEYIKEQIQNQAWLQDYNVRHNYSSGDRVDTILGDMYHIEHMVSSLVKSTQEALDGVFDIYTIAEWIELKIYPLVKRLKKIRDAGEMLKKQKVWPVRPMPIFRDLLNFGLRINDTSGGGRNRK